MSGVDLAAMRALFDERIRLRGNDAVTLGPDDPRAILALLARLDAAEAALGEVHLTQDGGQGSASTMGVSEWSRKHRAPIALAREARQ